jgi:4,5-DOPA dioxygenase extradiol
LLRAREQSIPARVLFLVAASPYIACMATDRTPVLFVSHGAPTFALEPGRLGPRLTAVGAELPRPRAVLVVSPHWTTRGLRVSTAARPATVHDFGGFDRQLYDIQYPAAGHPALAQRTAELLQAAGWPAQVDAAQGLDHGAWVPLRFLYPQADVPVFQLSLPAGLTSAQAYALGRALMPLRDEGVLVVGSGSLTHNLYEFRMDDDGREADYAVEFAAWVRQAVEARDHDRLARTLDIAPHAQRAHPTSEHFLPLLVAAGAAGVADGVQTLEGGITYGVLSMDSYLFGAARAASGLPG